MEQLGKVMTIGINRPEVRNCVDPATAAQLVTAFNRFEQTEEALVAVLHGKGQSLLPLAVLVLQMCKLKSSKCDVDVVIDINYNV